LRKNDDAAVPPVRRYTAAEIAAREATDTTPPPSVNHLAASYWANRRREAMRVAPIQTSRTKVGGA